MTGFVFYLLLPPGGSVVGFVAARLLTPRRPTHRQAVEIWLRAWMSIAAVNTLACVCAGLWLMAAGSAASLTIAAAIWWWFFRRRDHCKRIGALIGAKTRALRGRLVKRQRQAYRPPALQPT